ncbi:MAG: ATP-binding cassette domain-containing protein [Candidatus Omnitrophica bacterium]|nr:ATP-binding cassette domain-containing protein [Candidatus Omnitrophota bacterium]
MITENPKAIIAGPEAETMVRLENVSKQFGAVKALDKISFEIRRGEILGLLGPNGAGKTTAMRILAGYFPPTSGEIFIGENSLAKMPEKVKRMIGYLPEAITLYTDMSVMEILNFVAQVKAVSRKKRKQNIEETLCRCGLWDVRNRLLGQLSKGYKQRLGLAQALIGDPDVLILDEPTSGLDPEQINKIRALIHDLGREKTIVLSTHILPEVSMVCDRVVIINHGRVAASGTVEELEAGLDADHEITIVMGDRHRKNEVLALLESIRYVQRVSVLEERADRVAISIVIAHNAEVRPNINRLFAEKDIPLLELRTNRLSLEEIFLKLVVRENF